MSKDFITVVSGLPRSGTSMMMRILEAGGISSLTDRQRIADDDNPNGYYEFEAVKSTATDSSWIADAPGKAVKMVYSLLRDLPASHCYRVVFMRRHIDEILASQRRMLERNGKEISVEDVRMAELFRRELKMFDDWAAKQPHLTLLDVNYNDLLRDTSSQVQRINEFLGGKLLIREMTAVVDPSLYRNRAA